MGARRLQLLQGEDVPAQAAAAAAQSIGGGEDGPAAIAACAAAVAGLAAKGEGFSALGGVADQVQQLRDLVGLPLQVKVPRTTSCATATAQLHAEGSFLAI